MERIIETGLFYPNKFARITLSAFEDVLGENGLNSVLNHASLNKFVTQKPPDDLHRDFDFADLSSIFLAIENLYGPRGGRGLALRVGKVSYSDYLKHFGALSGFKHPEFMELPLNSRLEISLIAGSRLFSRMSDQTITLSTLDGNYIWSTLNCPVCQGRSNQDKPMCYSTIGFLQAMLTDVSGGLEFKITESKCQAMGDDSCEIIIQKEPLPVSL